MRFLYHLGMSYDMHKCIPLEQANYLSVDKRLTTTIRARLRFNVNNLNHSLFRAKQTNTDKCPHCPDLTETREHTLLFCPSTLFHRQNMINNLNDTPSIEQILNPTNKNTAKHTETYLLAINKTRRI